MKQTPYACIHNARQNLSIEVRKVFVEKIRKSNIAQAAQHQKSITKQLSLLYYETIDYPEQDLENFLAMIFSLNVAHVPMIRPYSICVWVLSTYILCLWRMAKGGICAAGCDDGDVGRDLHK